MEKDVTPLRDTAQMPGDVTVIGQPERENHTSSSKPKIQSLVTLFRGSSYVIFPLLRRPRVPDLISPPIYPFVVVINHYVKKYISHTNGDEVLVTTTVAGTVIYSLLR